MIGAFLALILLNLIYFFTNLFFFQRISVVNAPPRTTDLGWAILIVPVIGSTIVGLMARYGSERIRGHGIPEAIEAILIHGSRVDAKVALLKPLSAAISIGSGGPFGAEGPIIMTGGAVGSLCAQAFHLTAQERKTLLVGGAVAGMSATFATPVAAVLLAVELLLFEWKPRSLIPVAIASLTAFSVRYYLLGAGPLFPVPAHATRLPPIEMIACCLVGLSAGMFSAVLTSMVYFSEDMFSHLPIHWMWWPTIGGLVIGAGGLMFPRALGVGYGTIGSLLQGELSLRIIFGVLIVKSLIWSLSLGSGTSGGVLAPLLMMGAALGGVEAHVLPNEGAGYWELIAMAAMLGGTMRTPFTAVIFALELTHDLNMIAPLFAGVIFAYGFTVLTLKRSILTEKLSRRGYHLSREYAVDPLESYFVRDVMQSDVVALSPAQPADRLREAIAGRPQEIYPVTSADGALIGVLSRDEAVALVNEAGGAGGLAEALLAMRRGHIVTAGPREPLRAVAHRMARTGFTRFPVLDGDSLVGILTLKDLLKAQVRNLDAEHKRERHIKLHRFGRANRRKPSPAEKLDSKS